MTSTLSRALFVVPGDRGAGEWRPVIEQLTHRGWTVLAIPGVPLTPDGIRILREAGAEVADASPARPGAASRWRALPTWARTLASGPASIVGMMRVCRALRKQARAILDKAKPDVIVVGNDRSPNLEITLLVLGRARGVPSVVLPDALPVPAPEGLSSERVRALRFGRDYRVLGLGRRIMGILKPAWIQTYDGERVFAITPLWASIASLHGLMPVNPWALGGGPSTRVLVESPAVRDGLMHAGVPAAKIDVTGRPSHDPIARALGASQSRSRARSLAPAGVPLVVVAVPPYAEHFVLEWPEHMRLMEALFASLGARKEFASVVSLHPKCDPAVYGPLARRHGLVLGLGYTVYELIDVCDVFVTPHESSIVPPAVAARKPVIGLDSPTVKVFGPVMDESLVPYDRVGEVAAALVVDADRRRTLVEKQAPLAARWAMFDGKNTQRTTDAIVGVVKGI